MPTLSVEELRAALSDLKLDYRGNKDTLKKRLARALKAHSTSPSPPSPPAQPVQRTRPPHQDYDSFLVFDVEATCERIEGPYGRLAFAYPNEIIEWPVILLQWRQRDGVDEEDWDLVKVDEFHSFVKPMWKPQLSAFCTELTGIEQSDVDAAPTFPKLCRVFQRDFIDKHSLFTPENKTIWATDGPWDLRDFVAKTCYLSRCDRPPWLAGEMLDLRIAVANFFSSLKDERRRIRGGSATPPPAPIPPPLASSSPPPPEDPLPTPLTAPISSSLLPLETTPPPEPAPIYLPSHLLTAPSSLNLISVLASLTLPPFQGRLHSGLSDARNASRIVTDLAARGWRLEANRRVPEGGKGGKERRWGWMTRTGEVKWKEHVEWEEERAKKEVGEGKRRGGERVYTRKVEG